MLSLYKAFVRYTLPSIILLSVFAERQTIAQGSRKKYLKQTQKQGLDKKVREVFHATTLSLLFFNGKMW